MKELIKQKYQDGKKQYHKSASQPECLFAYYFFLAHFLLFYID